MMTTSIGWLERNRMNLGRIVGFTVHSTCTASRTSVTDGCTSWHQAGCGQTTISSPSLTQPLPPYSDYSTLSVSRMLDAQGVHQTWDYSQLRKIHRHVNNKTVFS